MFEPRPHNPLLAVVLMTTATAFIAMTTLLAKAIGTGELGQPLHPLQVSHGRFLFAFLALWGIAALRRPRLYAPRWRLHIGRTAFGWGGVTLMFASVAFIPLPDATAISFLNPVFAMMLAIPLLGERVGLVRWLAAGIALLGALILLRPTPASFQPAALLALGAAVLLGAEVILVKRLSGRESPFQILLINNTFGLGIASVVVLAFWQMPTGPQWLALAGIGAAMATAQICFVNAMARADASFIAPFSYGTLIFAALYDWAVFAAVPDAVSALGAGTIIGGAALLAWRETRARRAMPSTGSRDGTSPRPSR